VKDVPVLRGSVFRPREEKEKEGNIILGIRARDRVIAQAGDCRRSKVVGRAR
jgi:hypothetical protein